MRSVDERFYQPTYTDADISRICEHANIPETQHALTKHELEHFAAIWRSNKSRFSGPTLSPSQISNALKKVLRQADKLSELVEALPSEAFRKLRLADEEILSESLFEEDRDRTTAGHKITRYTTENGEETVLIDDLEDLLWSVEALAVVTQRAASDKHVAPKGPKYSIANRVWVGNVAAFWKGHLKREFTRDVLSSGEPISEASIFCTEAFHKLAPNVPQSTILNLMKNHIRNQRKKSTGKVSSKN